MTLPPGRSKSPPQPKTGEEIRRVGFLLLPSFSYVSLAAAIEPLFIANWLSQHARYKWQTLSIEGAAVEASNGLRFRTDGSIAAADRFDAVFLLASFDPKQHAGHRALRAWVNRQASHGAELGGIETGSEVLAAAGLLDGHDVAMHWDNLPGFQEVYPACRATARLYTVDRKRLTCAGASAVFDMMLHWIGGHHGPGLAGEIAQHLLLDRIRRPGDVQPLPATPPSRLADPTLQRALALMEGSIEEPLSLAALARRVRLSPRRLQRLFRRQLATSPSRHYRTLRLAKAHALLQQTDLAVTEVALSAGFASPEHFSRIYRAAFGRPPSADRRQSTDAPVLRRRAEK
jgi:AraC family transcriptional regulator, carnitine catabolism transcriptional activator